MSWPSHVSVTVAKRSYDLGSCVTPERALTGIRTRCKAGSVLRRDIPGVEWDLSFWAQEARPQVAKNSISFLMSVRPPAFNIAALTEWIAVKSDIWHFYGNLCRNLKFGKGGAKILGALHENLCVCCCCWRRKFAIKTFVCNTQLFVLLIVTFNSATHCHYTYIAYVTTPTDSFSPDTEITCSREEYGYTPVISSLWLTFLHIVLQLYFLSV